MPEHNLLGHYLKDRRAKLNPAEFGISGARRRTPGLRREEVAQRANVSATWYTWLEQGRGGPPSADTLDRLAQALELSAAEREHLFLLALHRPPEVRDQLTEQITPQLQRVLDSLAFSPAYVKTALWDVVGWNEAAAAVLTDYAALAPRHRNILRLLFCDPRTRKKMVNWEDDARAAVAAFRTDVRRAGSPERVQTLVGELSQASAEFRGIWGEYGVQNFGEGTKRFCHPALGPLTLEYSTFAVEGCSDLSLVIYTPQNPTDLEYVKAIVEASAKMNRGQVPAGQTTG